MREREREQPFNKEESKQQEHRPPMRKKVWKEVNDGEE
jgi:hypothetical protein